MPANDINDCFEAPFDYLRTVDFTFFSKTAPETCIFNTTTTDRALAGPFRDVSPLRLCHESDFEDYFEHFGQICRRNRLAKNLTMIIIYAKLATEVASSIESLDIPDEVSKDPELFIEMLGSVLYPNSQYHTSVALTIWNASPQPSTVTALSGFLRPIQRYLRLCKRHMKKVSVTDTTARFFLLSTLPLPVTNHLLLHHHDLSLAELVAKTREIGSRIEAGTSPSTSISYAPAYLARPNDLDLSLDEIKARNPKPFRVHPNAVPIVNDRDRCHGCLGKHRRKDCPFHNWRCDHCHTIGHLTRACNKIVTKDRTGRILTSLDRSGGRTQLTVHQDHTQGDRLTTVQNAMADIKERVSNETRARKVRYHSRNPKVRPRLRVPAFTAPYYDPGFSYLPPEEEPIEEDYEEPSPAHLASN